MPNSNINGAEISIDTNADPTPKKKASNNCFNGSGWAESFL